MWTIVVVTYGWMNLPRAQQMPHNPQFLSKLSNEASSILLGSGAKAEPARGALVWSQTPMIVRMSNGTRLTFPATTTDERAAFVASEYRQLLNVKADEQKGPYLLGMLALWLAPVLLLIAGFAASLIWRGYKPPLTKLIPGSPSPSSIGRTVASAFAISGTSNRTDGYPMGLAPPIRFPCRFDAPAYANGELFRSMFANEQSKPRARATIA
jgi:hypothetical protein